MKSNIRRVIIVAENRPPDATNRGLAPGGLGFTEATSNDGFCAGACAAAEIAAIAVAPKTNTTILLRYRMLMQEPVRDGNRSGRASQPEGPFRTANSPQTLQGHPGTAEVGIHASIIVMTSFTRQNKTKG